jgi:hypothetical protein
MQPFGCIAKNPRSLSNRMMRVSRCEITNPRWVLLSGFVNLCSCGACSESIGVRHNTDHDAFWGERK